MKSKFFPIKFLNSSEGKEYFWLYTTPNIAVVKEPEFTINIYTKDNLYNNISLEFYSTRNIKKLDFCNGKLLEYTEEEISSTISNFRGIISGYPKYKLHIEYYEPSTKLTEEFECDAIRAVGGVKENLPFTKNLPHLKFYKISPQGKVSVLKVLDKWVNKIKVASKEHFGQIPGTFISTLSPSAFDEYIDKCKASYMGRPSHDWIEVYGNHSSYSDIQGLYIKINFEAQILSFQLTRNLYERTYTIHSNSSMDPGDDECTDSTDLFIWAHLHFNETSLLYLMNKLLKIGDINGNYISFKSKVSTIEFEQITGIHLNISIIETQNRY